MFYRGRALGVKYLAMFGLVAGIAVVGHLQSVAAVGKVATSTLGRGQQRLTAGGNQSLAIKTGGTLWGWGFNNVGQLCDGTTTQHLVPVQAAITGITQISTSTFSAGNAAHTLMVAADQSAWGCGSNAYGQLGDGTTVDRSSPVQTSGLTGVLAVGAGQYHSIALKSDGTVWGWGYNGNGQVGDGTRTERLSPVQVVSLTGVIAIAAGYEHNVALKSDGTVWTWGYNGWGQLGNGTTTDSVTPLQVPNLTGVVAVIAGEDHTLVLKNDGTVWSWGDGHLGQLGNGSFGFNYSPVQASGLTNVIAIAAGDYHTVVAKSDGTVWAWGLNASGQLGNSSTTNSDLPVQASGLTGVLTVAGGSNHSLALKSDGTIWGWGDNTNGQLGNGTTTASVTPVMGPSGFSVAPVPDDFDGDGAPDLVWQNDTTGQLLVWYLTGTQGNTWLGGALLSGSAPGWRIAGTGDFNQDGKPDLVWQNDATRQVVVWYMTGAEGSTYSGSAALSGSTPGWTVAAVADLNRDGAPDLIWQNDSTRQALVWYMTGAQGSTYMSSSLLSGPAPGWKVVGTTDFNGDGIPDLIWQNDSTRQVVVWYMGGAQGNTYASSAALSGNVSGWTVIGAGDFNRDGVPDLVWQNDSTRQVLVWYLSGTQGSTYLGNAWLAGPTPGWTASVR